MIVFETIQNGIHRKRSINRSYNIKTGHVPVLMLYDRRTMNRFTIHLN